MDATPSAQGSAFRCTIAATADSATQLQQQFTAWLDTACRPSAQRRDDVVLAVGEATNNAVEHAYACTRTGQVEVNGGAYNPEAPFGGYKASSTQTFKEQAGASMMEFYTLEKTVYLTPAG